MRESKILEFKERVSDTFLKTVTAFSNYEGGRIIFGINDLGEKVGIKNIKDEVIKIEHKINDSISPQVNFTLNIDQENNIILLDIIPGDEMPYLYKSKTYRRNDTSTIEVDMVEYKNLILQGKNKSYDSLTNEKNDNNFRNLEKKFNELLNVDSINNDVLKSLELMNKNNQYTNAGNMFADENNYKILDIVKFGENQDIIMNRYQIKNCSLLEAYDKSVEIFNENYIYEKIEGSYRKKVELVPERAFREAVANALVHRDWMIDSYVQISMEDEWIVITSPGGLPKEVSEIEYLEGRISKMRNPIIGNIFFRLNIIESFGTGIKRIKRSYANNSKKPIFKVYDNSIEVKLPIIVKYDELTEDQRKIYMIIENKEMASSEIVQNTGFGKNKVLDILQILSDKGYVQKVGNGRGTKYKIR
ncbi:RNA-binding domain-containing protein [Helcococcus bovis]|uniref:RNA-binding domain-containing protein n=1 Tax=Helcococcus bovis TaxID=3153252 RepID=UPI0038BD611C